MEGILGLLFGNEPIAPGSSLNQRRRPFLEHQQERGRSGTGQASPHS